MGLQPILEQLNCFQREQYRSVDADARCKRALTVTNG